MTRPSVPTPHLVLRGARPDRHESARDVGELQKSPKAGWFVGAWRCRVRLLQEVLRADLRTAHQRFAVDYVPGFQSRAEGTMGVRTRLCELLQGGVGSRHRVERSSGCSSAANLLGGRTTITSVRTEASLALRWPTSRPALSSPRSLRGSRTRTSRGPHAGGKSTTWSDPTPRIYPSAQTSMRVRSLAELRPAL